MQCQVLTVIGNPRKSALYEVRMVSKSEKLPKNLLFNLWNITFVLLLDLKNVYILFWNLNYIAKIKCEMDVAILEKEIWENWKRKTSFCWKSNKIGTRILQKFSENWKNEV